MPVSLLSVIFQKGPDGKEMVVAFDGRSLRPDERKSEQECLAVVEGTRAYREYLSYQKFVVYTNRQAQKWLNTVKDTVTILGRKAIHLQAYQYDIVHKQGSLYQNADALSRRSYENEDSVESEIESINTVELDQKPKHYTHVHFWYESAPTISVAESADPVSTEDQLIHFKGKDISDLQKECPDFHHMFKN